MQLLALAAMTLAALPDTTTVSGEVYGVWTTANSPYAVVGEVTVPAGCTLSIEPGVEVRFRGGYRFVVNGLLKAVGTEQDSIFFTRDRPIEDHKWKGIRFTSSASGCTLAFAAVEYARNDGPFPEVRGGGIYCKAAAPVISHCSIRHNYSHNENYNGMGGGVCADNAEPVVEHCHIFDNYVDSGGGIGTIEDGQAIIQNCVIEDNTATYSGGGMYLGVRSGPRVFANIIRNNRCTSGWGGGGVTLWNWYAANPVSKQVYNNLVAYNSASDAGGGMYTRYDLSYIYNNTFFGNSASRGGGIYVLNEGAYLPDVRNTIVWANSAGQGPSIYLDPANSSDITVTWSDIEGGWSGSGNFDSVPHFADTVWFRLAMPSRCIDAGTSAGPPAMTSRATSGSTCPRSRTAAPVPNPTTTWAGMSSPTSGWAGPTQEDRQRHRWLYLRSAASLDCRLELWSTTSPDGRCGPHGVKPVPGAGWTAKASSWLRVCTWSGKVPGSAGSS